MEYITPIYDRTAADVITAGNNVGLIDPKGTINFKDLNRIENNTRVVANTMRAKGIVDFEITLNSKYNWQETDIPTKNDLNRIINNILILQQYSVTGLQLEKLGLNSQWSWKLANAIEKNLDIMYKQEPRPEGLFNLKVMNGLGTGDYADNTVVNVEAFMPSANKIFKCWTGDAEDLVQLENVNAAQTTFTINHQDAEITAEYKSSLPHKFKIVNGTATNLTNPQANTDNYMEGDIIRVVAGPCPLDHVYWGWLVNDFVAESDSYITTYEIEEAFTYQTAQITTFIMPAADVEIEAKYIYPGEHTLKVINGLGSGEYNFGDLVGIRSREDELSDDDWNYKFEYWSGPATSLLADDYEYLDDNGNPIVATKAPRVTLRMEDYNTEITANYSRYLKEPSQVNTKIYIINSDDLKHATTEISVDSLDDITGIKRLYSEQCTKFSNMNYSAPTDIIEDVNGIRWQFSYWARVTNIYTDTNGKITKIDVQKIDDKINHVVSMGNKDTIEIIVRTRVVDVNLEYCRATSIHGNIVSKNNILSIPSGVLFSLSPVISELDDGFNSDTHKITNDGYTLSDDSIVKKAYNYYIDEDNIAENDILKITYWRKFRDKYWYTATIFPDGDITSEGTVIDTFKEDTAISLSTTTIPEGKSFDGWYMGTVNKYTTTWSRINSGQSHTLNMTTRPSDMLLLPNLCTQDDPR